MHMKRGVAVAATLVLVSFAVFAAYALASVYAAKAFDGKPGVWCDEGDPGWERP